MSEKKIHEEFPELYHYTNLTGLNGIIENQSLWAMHYQFTSDSSEIEYGSKLIESDLEGIHREFVQLEKEVVDGNIFIVSFCTHEDKKCSKCLGKCRKYEREHGLLSMWRGYGKEQGYCLIFETKSLEDSFISNERYELKTFRYILPILGDVLYDRKRHQNNIKNLKTQNFVTLTETEKDKFLKEYIKAKYLFKHEGFEEEEEIRIVMIPRFKDNGEELDKEKKEINFIKDTNPPVPYIELKAPSDHPLRIKKIIIGPGKDQKKKKKSLELWLQQFGSKTKDIDIVLSDTPYLSK